jgi:hypothetical protein
MGRKILAVIVAMFMAGAIFMIIEMIATMIPLFSPKNLEYWSSSEREVYFSSMPLGSYITIAFGAILASVAGGWIVTNIAKANESNALPVFVAALLSFAGLFWYFAFLPGQPYWLIAFSLILTFPFAIIGHRLARRW